jgi:hypothetical protein
MNGFAGMNGFAFANPDKGVRAAISFCAVSATCEVSVDPI